MKYQVFSWFDEKKIFLSLYCSDDWNDLLMKKWINRKWKWFFVFLLFQVERDFVRSVLIFFISWWWTWTGIIEFKYDLVNVSLSLSFEEEDLIFQEHFCISMMKWQKTEKSIENTGWVSMWSDAIKFDRNFCEFDLAKSKKRVFYRWIGENNFHESIVISEENSIESPYLLQIISRCNSHPHRSAWKNFLWSCLSWMLSQHWKYRISNYYLIISTKEFRCRMRENESRDLLKISQVEKWFLNQTNRNPFCSISKPGVTWTKRNFDFKIIGSNNDSSWSLIKWKRVLETCHNASFLSVWLIQELNEMFAFFSNFINFI